MSINKIAISFATSTVLVFINKFFIGSNSVEVGDIWHKVYFTLNALAYSIPAFTILHYLKGWFKYVFTLVPSYYLEWAYASWFYSGGLSCLDMIELILGVTLIALIANYKKVRLFLINL